MLAIRTENLGKTYRGNWRGKGGTCALRGLNLEVRLGEVFGFLGPNGAGKTTTIHLLLNLIRPSKGAAFVFDCPSHDTTVHRRIGYLPESVNLHDYYRGKRLLEFYAALLGTPRPERSARADDLLKLLGLQEAGDKQVSKYSKGMLQRIGFAQALLHDPDLLILDEPTSSLDPIGRKEFRDVLLQLKGRSKTVFISSHILSEVESVCDRVAILQNGELKRVGTLPELSSAATTRIVVKSLPAALMEAVTALSVRLTIEQGQVTILCRDAASRRKTEELLAAHQVQVLQTEVEAQSLEDIFFSTINAAPSP